MPFPRRIVPVTTRSSFRPTTTSPLLYSIIPTWRQFSTTPRQAIKESEDPQQPGAAEAKEAEKNEQLRKQEEGKGHWHEGLSSNGESAVKADREDAPGSEKGIEGLQEQTAKKAEEEKKGGS